MHSLLRRRVLAGAACAALASATAAAPRHAPSRHAAPSGPIALHVDAREAPRKILHARLRIPVTPGPLSLRYPEWIPGEHSPSGPIANLAGVKVSVGGRALAWRRDPGAMFALRVVVPAGASALDVELDALLPSSGTFTGGRAASSALAVVSWNTLLLYPDGHASDALTYAASLQLPDGWTQASALPVAGSDASGVRFAPVTLTRLVDSPVLAGAHARSVPIESRDGVPHALHLAADTPAALELKPEWAQGLGRLADEALLLFGARHYTRYGWQLALSEHVEHFGLEHHESSDNRLSEDTLADDAGRRRFGGLLSHEYVHSWNGKYRRPADLATGDFHTPMKSDLLWVYEGLTQYLGQVLAVRSELLRPEEGRELLARIAAHFEHAPGRQWRALEDTATAAQILYPAPPEWARWRREVDFYDEMALVWLEADALIREKTAGARSLDDFCRAFHGGPDGPYVVKPYTRADVIAALSAVAAHDWAGFFAARVDQAGAPVPLGGLGGWKLVYTSEPNTFIADREKADDLIDESASLGVVIKVPPDKGHKDYGRLIDVAPGLPAARAGLAPGMRLVAINGRRFTKDLLRPAIAATARGQALELLADNDDFFRSFRLEYSGGLRFPHLVRDEAQPDHLATAWAPRATPR